MTVAGLLTRIEYLGNDQGLIASICKGEIAYKRLIKHEEKEKALL